MSSVDRMMQGKPAGKFDERTIDTIKTILSGHDEASELLCPDDLEVEGRDMALRHDGVHDEPCEMLIPVTDVQPKPKLSAQAVLDAQEEALLTGKYPEDPPKPVPAAEKVPAPKIELIIEPEQEEAELDAVELIAGLPDEVDVDIPSAAVDLVEESAVSDAPPAEPMPDHVAPDELQPIQGQSHPDVTDAAISQIVKRDKIKRKLRRKGGFAAMAKMVSTPFVTVYRIIRGLILAAVATLTGMANGIGWVRITLARLKNWFEPHLTRRRVFLLAYVALFALRPILMLSLTVLFIMAVGWAFFRHGPDRVWFGVFRLIAQYSEVNSEDAALMRNRFDRFAVRWNSAARFLPETAGQAIAVPDFEALEAQDRAHDARMAERLQRMHSQV